MSEPSYKNLKSYQQAVIICDLTFEFSKKYINPKSRTVDQMEQAARSGKQNIVEGCAAGKHNPKTEVKLLGVARASFEELLEDYSDFLRQNNFSIWGKDDPKAIEIRNLYKTDKSYMAYKSYMNDSEKIANAMITLINQTNFLLDRQINAVKKQKEEEGIILFPHNEKVGRILKDQEKKEKEFDEWVKKELEKNKKKDL